MKTRFLISFQIIFLFILILSTFTFSETLDDSCGPSDNLCIINNIIDVNYNNPLELTNNLDANLTCGVYFTGIGCPHCAKIDPVLFKDIIVNNPKLVIIEFEAKQKKENARLSIGYDDIYNSGFDTPFLIFNKENVFNYQYILSFFENDFNSLNNNACPFPTSVYPDGTTSFSKINLNNLNSSPVIWYNDRALEKTSFAKETSNDFLHKLLTDSNIELLLENSDYNYIKEAHISYSGGTLFFDNAVDVNGWIIYFNGECSLVGSSECKDVDSEYGTTEKANYERLSLLKVITLALADAVNPCSFAVLLILLLTITTLNPDNKRKILYSGLAFSFSIFVLYFLYGLILVTFFSAFSGNITVIIYKFFAVVAILLGAWQIRDYIYYKPGTVGTEMPLSLRPKVKKIISRATSPLGAGIVGVFVSLFLLPCTIGPYIIATSSLALIDILKSIPLLLLYNLIFILPMVFITIIIYFGLKKIEDIGAWKEKNIKYFHLITGALILLLGLLMLFGLL